MYNLACSTALDSDYQVCLSTLEGHVTIGIGQTAPTYPAASRIPSVNALDEEHAMEEAFKDDDGAPATPLGGVLALADRQDVHFKVICTFVNAHLNIIITQNQKS